MDEKIDLLTPEVRAKLEEVIREGILTNEKLSSILNSLVKKYDHKKKKVSRQQNGVKAVPAYRLKSSELISAGQSLEIWKNLAVSEKKLETCAPESRSSIFNDPQFNFKKAVLNGLSIKEMAERFPEQRWGHLKEMTKKNTPGRYLVSYENPLVNLSLEGEKTLHPEECFRLDFNLTVELLLGLSHLGIFVPKLYYRTTHTTGRFNNQEEICVGLENGKLNFLTENKVRKMAKMGIILVKSENWSKDD